jgi:hypothetical protein
MYPPLSEVHVRQSGSYVLEFDIGGGYAASSPGGNLKYADCIGSIEVFNTKGDAKEEAHNHNVKSPRIGQVTVMEITGILTRSID